MGAAIAKEKEFMPSRALGYNLCLTRTTTTQGYPDSKDLSIIYWPLLSTRKETNAMAKYHQIMIYINLIFWPLWMTVCTKVNLRSF